MLFLASLVVGVVLGLFVSVGLQRALSPEQAPAQGAADPATAAAQRSPDGSSGLDAEERHTIELFKEASRSVAFITTQVERVDYWSRNVFEVPAGSGSGFLWDDKGHVVTNFHVVQNSDSQKVALGAATFEAETVGTARDQDLAVLRIKAPGQKLVPIKLGTSSGLSVGQKVYAIGNPFGFDYSLTQGIVSALGRTIQSPSSATIFDVIQTDAAINMGNSGGALIDAKGRLVGINSAILSPSSGNIGIGFTIPVNLAASIMRSLIETGKVSRGYLGIVPSSATDELNEQLGVAKGTRGVVIAEVIPDSPAEKAGLLRTDFVLSINDRVISSPEELRLTVAQMLPGSMVKIKIMRDGKEKSIDLPLGQLTENPKELFTGVNVDPLTEETRRSLGISRRINGLVVTDVAEDSPFHDNFSANMVIMEINRQPVTDLATAKTLVKTGRNLLAVYDQGGARIIVITVQ
jgi:serine protease Do/serine protease DegQ